MIKSKSTQSFRLRSRRDAVSMPRSYLSINRLDDGSVNIEVNEQTVPAVAVSSAASTSQLRRVSSLPPSKPTTISLLSEVVPKIDLPPTPDTEDDDDDDEELEALHFLDLLRQVVNDESIVFDDELSSHRDSAIHRCFAEDDDPTIGIVNSELVKKSCCSFKAFVDIPAEGAASEASMTSFGKRLRQIDNAHDQNFRSLMTDYWGWNWSAGVDSLRSYLYDAFRHKDDDHVEWFFGDCSVCFASCRFVKKSPCCGKTICQPCWQQYVRTAAENAAVAVNLTGMYDLHCFGCEKFVPYSEALSSLESEDINRVRPPGHASCTVARCPVCLKVPPPMAVKTKAKQSKFAKQLRKKRGGRPILCDRCNTTFCGVCGMADHPKLSCEQLTVSEKGLSTWSRQKNNVRPEFPNGRHCPVCKIPVTHSGGCPHMTCPCGAEFCFSCGRKYIKRLAFIFPGHTSNRLLPIVSCPKMWDSTSKRIAVHSLVGFGLIAGAVPLAVALSPIVISVGATVMLVRKLKRRNR